MAAAMALIALIVPLSSAAADTPPAAMPLASTSYAFITIDVPGAAKTFAMDRNSVGDIVGYYIDASGVNHGFLLSHGAFTTLDFPGSDVSLTQADAISPTGDIVGGYSLKTPAPAGNFHGFLRTMAGVWSTVDYPVGTHLMAGGAFAILADGTMVGCYHDGTASGLTSMNGYVMGPNGTSSFDYPANAPYAMHYGVTPDGKTIVGGYLAGTNTPDNWHGYLLNAGKVTSFDVPGKLGTQAMGINGTGGVVGVYKVLVDKTWNAHGFVAATHGSINPADWGFTMVDVPGASQTTVRGITDGGALVGYYVDASGVTHGYLASVGAAVTTPPAAVPAPPNTGNSVVDTSRSSRSVIAGALVFAFVVFAAGTVSLRHGTRPTER